jgi:hypothetical protein
MKEMVYGVKSGWTLEQYIAENILHPFPSFYAFLRNRHWHENERLGWFGGSTVTECEVHNEERVGKCLFRDEKTGAQVLCWKSDKKNWASKFYDRFVKSLDPETLLVSVDYHV